MKELYNESAFPPREVAVPSSPPHKTPFLAMGLLQRGNALHGQKFKG